MSTSVSSDEAVSGPVPAAQTVKYSVLIPVYNSADLVGRTIDRTVAFFKEQDLSYEIVLVNDGSRDRSWQVIKEKASRTPNVVAINLLRNYGQHMANFCGLQYVTGDYVITLDDDLQNPPEEIIHLISKAQEGHDVVFGQFRAKRHSLARKLGSKLIGLINHYIFHKPKGLAVSNFRILRRDVVDRIRTYRAHYPYTTGLALLFSNNPANVTVAHREREQGKSNYTLFQIAKLVMTILFSYSSFPLRLSAALGFAVAIGSFSIGGFFLVHRFVSGTEVPGWTTLVVLLAFFNGVSTLMLSMLGEYVIRVLNQISVAQPYDVIEKVTKDG